MNRGKMSVTTETEGAPPFFAYFAKRVGDGELARPERAKTMESHPSSEGWGIRMIVWENLNLKI
jgi:hypothetical protein